jgi:hypothetical protein
MGSSRFTSAVAGLALIFGLCTAAAARGVAANAVTPHDEEEAVNALIGELVFQADLMNALDRLCPRGGAVDWHASLAPRVRDAYTPELRELSRKLGRAAGLQLVRERGGCQTSDFSAAYDESKQDFRDLLQRWRSAGR